MSEQLIIKNKGNEFILSTAPITGKFEKCLWLSDKDFRRFELDTKKKKVLFGMIEKSETIAHVKIIVAKAGSYTEFEVKEFDLTILPSEIEIAKKIELILKPYIQANLNRDDYNKKHFVMWVTLEESSGADSQNTLKELIAGKIKFENIKRREINDKIYITVNDFIVGCVPSNQYNEFKRLADRECEILDYEITGGKGKDEHGVRKPFLIGIKYSFLKNDDELNSD